MKRQQRRPQPNAPHTHTSVPFQRPDATIACNETTMHRGQQGQCDCCGAAFDREHVKMTSQSQGAAEEKPGRPALASKACRHRICLECALNVHLQDEAKSEHGSPTSLPWMDCPVCDIQFAFHADMLGGEPHVYAHRQVKKLTAPASYQTGYHQHHHHYHPSSYYHFQPHYSPQPPHYDGSYQTPYHDHNQSPYVTPPHDVYRLPGHPWQTMDHSPSLQGPTQPNLPVDFHPPLPPASSGLAPPDFEMDVRIPPRTSVDDTSSPPLPRKRLRTPVSRKPESYSSTASATRHTRTESQVSTESTQSAPLVTSSSLSHNWLTCRICQKPVVMTCQRLLSGPPPDHEALWPQVRLGKRLAAALRQHNQQHHPDCFMWNVKGRAAMTTSSSGQMEEDDAVAQTAMIKALEASFEHLPHMAGEDKYDTKSEFMSRTLRRIGYAYAYISYTSSEWTKWQQWNKDGYSRVQIQAKARQLLEKYEGNLSQAIHSQWSQISTWTHQEKLDLFQNIFVLPQCIFECLHHNRLPMHYFDVTESEMS